MNLNTNQLRAVKHTNGPLLIIAGAGTGKTTVITERIKYLISKGLAKPEEILALTFTEKAALEMETRVDEVMPLSYGDIWINTFHSFCDQILRDSGLDIGLPTNFKLMTTAESIDLFKKNLFNFSLDYYKPLGNPNKFIEEILKHISRLQDEIVYPEDYLKWVEKIKINLKKSEKDEEKKLEIKKYQELAKVYQEYSNLKLKEAKFDFGDLIVMTLKLFEQRPNVLKRYQQKFKYVLVDEFQDTNYAQNELVKKLVQKSKNITVVGDDNQSIYRFRGASVSNILQFKKDYKNIKVITLNENYRSTQNILDGAYNLIKHNDPYTLEYKLGIDKKLIAKNSKNDFKIEFIHSETDSEEATFVVDEILSLLDKNKDLNYSDFAILVRANNHADIFVRELERRGVPQQFLGPSKLFEKPEIIDLICYLKVLYNPEDTESLFRLLSSDIFSFKPLDILTALTKSKRKSISLFEEISEKEEFKKIIGFINKHLNEINIKTTGEILYEFVKEIGIYEKVIASQDLVVANNIALFFKRIKNYENENPNAKIFEVVDYIKLLSEVGESPIVTNEEWQNNNAVNILTVHSSKGLEFKNVFMVNLVSDRFPTRTRSEVIPIPNELIKEKLPQGDFHLQEERRLFYVGATRAKERLYFTASNFYNDGKREKKISPFIFESLKDINNSLRKTNKNFNINFDKSNKNIKIKLKNKPIVVNYLSVSQIETFENCPLHYKLKYIYNLPTPKTASISFGISIHETLKNIYGLFKKGQKVNEEKLLKIFASSFINEGFENKKHKEQFFKKGQEYLLGYFRNEFNKKIIPESLEQKFTLNLFKDLKVGGTIDRVDRLSENSLEIIDYKTGANIPTQKDVDRDLQLSVYALATSNIYKIKPENIKLSLYYLDNQEKISTKRTTKELEEVKDKLYEYKIKIENSNFKCSNSYFCQNGCEFKMFCK